MNRRPVRGCSRGCATIPMNFLYRAPALRMDFLRSAVVLCLCHQGARQMNRGALAALAAGVGFALAGTAAAQNSNQGQVQGQIQGHGQGQGQGQDQGQAQAPPTPVPGQGPAPTAQAAPEKETWNAPFGGSWTATFAFATDYSYRGISQTQRQVA